MAAHSPIENAFAPGRLALARTAATPLQQLQKILGLWDGVPGSAVRKDDLPPWEWVTNDEWRKLQGILSDHPEHDTSGMKAADRTWEEEHDARKFGRSGDR